MEVDRSSHKTALRRNFARLCNEIDSTALALKLYENRVISDCQLDLTVSPGFHDWTTSAIVIICEAIIMALI